MDSDKKWPYDPYMEREQEEQEEQEETVELTNEEIEKTLADCLQYELEKANQEAAARYISELNKRKVVKQSDSISPVLAERLNGLR